MYFPHLSAKNKQKGGNVMKRLGNTVIEFENDTSVLSYASVAGSKEGEGPLGKEFDMVVQDSYFGEKSWEKAEAKFQQEALELAMRKSGVTAEDIHMIFAGDLLNQCTASSFAAADRNIPFLGQYGACSTMAQAMLMASMAVDSKAAELAAAVSSSHFCTAERQFRLPLEYGGQRSTTAQWTVTAAGAVLLGRGGKVKVKRAAAGRIVDLGVKDTANMGAAMAPAAANTIYNFLLDCGASPRDYDAIFTGDLGLVGSRLLQDILFENGVEINSVHRDCGLMIYYLKEQDVHAGASGCGCCASVLCSHILPALERAELRRVLFCPTGAMMSVVSSQQGRTIPGICHVLELGSE